MFKRLTSLLPKLGTIVLAGYLFWLGWVHLGPRKPEIGPVRKDLADRVVQDVVKDIRAKRGDVQQAVLLHFKNDLTDYFTDSLRCVVEQRGTLSLRDRTVMEKLRNLLHLKQSGYADQDAALSQARRLKAESVLYGNIQTFESFPGGANIDVQVKWTEVATGQSIFDKNYTLETSSPSMIGAVIQEATQAQPWFQRLLGWLILVLLLPVFTINFIRTMIRKQSNKTNAFVLTVYTVTDALLAWLLVGVAISNWWTTLIFIAAVGAALAYNIRIMTLAVKLEEA